MKKLLNKIWPILLTLILSMVFSGSGKEAIAQENPDEVARKYNVTFPIAELGNCENYSACRTFCEDPVNSTSCIEFAKKKGFYKQDQTSLKKEEILQKAKQTLGCDSYESCQSLCSKSENFSKCDSFAKSNNLVGGNVDNPEEKRILQKAKEILGCESPSSCMSYCEKLENRDKCSQFAKETGLRGGEQRIGPGGCTSEETCKAFCSDPGNYNICSGFSKGTGGQFSGPGGCNSEESCRAFCKEHPRECGYNDDGGRNSPPPGSYNPQEMCNKTPSCKWESNTCKCGYYDNPEEAKRRAEEYARFCRENPTRCGVGHEGDFANKKEREKFEKYCRDNPDKCDSKNFSNTSPGYNSSGSSGSSGSYSTGTYRTCPSGQYWNGENCIAGFYSSGSTSTGGSSGNYSGNIMSRDQQEAGCRAGGGTCNWSGDTCNCQGYKSSGSTTTGTSGSSSGSSMSREQQETGCRSCNGTCNWNGDSCNCRCGSTATQTSVPQSTQAPAQTEQPTQTQPPTQTGQPQTEQQQQPQSSPTVQGLNTSKGLLEIILERIFSILQN